MATIVTIEKSTLRTEVQGWGRHSSGKKTQTFEVTSVSCETRDGRQFHFECKGYKNGAQVNTFFFSRDPKLDGVKKALREDAKVCWYLVNA